MHAETRVIGRKNIPEITKDLQPGLLPEIIVWGRQRCCRDRAAQDSREPAAALPASHDNEGHVPGIHAFGTHKPDCSHLPEISDSANPDALPFQVLHCLNIL